MNLYDFTSLENIFLLWELEKDGNILSSGTVDQLCCPPHQSKEYHLDLDIPSECCFGCHLNLSFRLKEDTIWADRSYEIAFEQAELPVKRICINSDPCTEQITVSSSDEYYVIKGKDFIYTLNTEMFMYHLVTHLAKHVKYKGAGIRNLCDIYLFMKNNKINYEIVKNELEKKGLTTFFETLVKLIELVFDYKDEKLKSDALKEDARELLSFMLRYGVYGAQSENNVFVNSQLKKSITLREKIIIVFSKFFPGSKKLSDKYMYAKKCVLLLPFAWIHRLFDKRFIDKKTLKDTAGEMKKANEIMDLQADMIKKFKL